MSDFETKVQSVLLQFWGHIAGAFGVLFTATGLWMIYRTIHIYLRGDSLDLVGYLLMLLCFLLGGWLLWQAIRMLRASKEDRPLK